MVLLWRFSCLAISVTVRWQVVLDVVSFALGQLRVAHGNLSCEMSRMLPHTGLL